MNRERIIKYVFQWVFTTLSVVLLAACQPTADSSDEVSLSESIASMTENRSAEESERLAQALHILALTETGYLGEPAKDPVAVASDVTLGPALLRVLDGDTFDDIIEKATQVKMEELQAAMKSAQRAQQDVRARIAQASAEIEKLSEFGVKQTKYGWSKGDYLPQAFVEFHLVNRSNEPVTGVKLRSQLTTPDRDIPWVNEVLSHEMVRALPARTSLDYRLVPNQFSAWGNRNLQNRRDTRLSMEIINIRLGSEWLVSADPLALEKELNLYLTAENDARNAWETIKAKGHI